MQLLLLLLHTKNNGYHEREKNTNIFIKDSSIKWPK